MVWLLKSLFARFLGFVFYNYYMGVYRPYYGRQKVYQKLLDDSDNSIIKKALHAYINDDFRIYRECIRDDYKFYQTHKTKARISRKVLGDSLKSYGKLIYEDGGETFEEQQRGLILRFLKPFLDENSTSLNICEIGADNGDVIAHLAKTYPSKTCAGIDFSVDSARILHGDVKNLEFFEGYALEMFQNGTVKPDVVYGSSTFMFFTPKELQAYLKTLRDGGCKNIFISEPVWGGYKPSEKLGTYSRHMEDIVWFHNYFGYMKDAGYNIEKYEGFDYKHPHSEREDILQVIYHAKAA